MNPHQRLLTVLMTAQACWLALAGCSSGCRNADTITWLDLPCGCVHRSHETLSSRCLPGAPTYAAVSPADVQVLRQYPEGGYVRIGDVRIDPSGDMPDDQVATLVQEGGATLGASAVVITMDNTRRCTLCHSVRGTAIRYRGAGAGT